MRGQNKAMRMETEGGEGGGARPRKAEWMRAGINGSMREVNGLRSFRALVIRNTVTLKEDREELRCDFIRKPLP